MATVRLAATAPIDGRAAKLPGTGDASGCDLSQRSAPAPEIETDGVWIENSGLATGLTRGERGALEAG